MTRSGTLLRGRMEYAKTRQKEVASASIQMKNKAGEQLPEAIVALADRSGSLRKRIYRSQERAKLGFSRYNSFHAHLM